MLSFIIFLLSVILIIIKKKVNKRLWCVLCFIPLAISIIHFIVYFVPNDFIIRNFLFMYIFSILFLVLPFIYNKEKIFKISSIIIIILGFISFFMTFYNTIMVENIHNLNYYSYTDSFNKTISILKKEYVLNEHKKIDYDKLYSKYYPLIEQAENENNEQLYYKTMFEFSKNFKDGHFGFEIYYTTLEETIRRLDFANDYYNKDYGFGSVLLSDGNIVAILVDENSEAYNKGLRDGMIITKKDNIDIHKVLDEIITHIGAYPVLEDERLLNSFYLFGQGNDEINVSFLNEENEEITITIRAADNTTSKLDELCLKIMHQDYDLENLDTKMLDSNTGYIYVSNEMYSPFKGAVGYLFDDSSYLTKVVDEKLQNLINQGMTDLIIDLRANSGGYLTESEAIASLFTNDSYLVAKDAKYFSNLYDKSYLRGNGKAMIFTPNPEMVMEARKNKEFMKILNSSTMNVPDGIGIVYGSKFTSNPIKHRVAGYDLMLVVFDKMKDMGKTAYFFGGAPEIADRAKEAIEKRFPGLKVVGTANGYFDSEREKEIIAEINELKPDLLLVGIGFPKQ